MDQWLVRTSNNIIAGPYSRDQVVKLIHEGKLGLQDEVCQANQYWIFLHEHLEVLRQLNISMPKSSRAEEEEVTETQTDTASTRSNPTIELDLSPVPETPADYDGGTALISRGTFNDAKSSAQSATDPELSVESMEIQLESQPPTHIQRTAAAQTSASVPSVAQPLSVSSGPSSAVPARTSPSSSAVAAARPVINGSPAGNAPDRKVERSAVWKVFAWLMILIFCAIVYAVLTLLNSTDPI